MPAPAEISGTTADGVWRRAGWCACLLGLVLVAPGEFVRCQELWRNTHQPLTVLFHWNIDSTPFAPLLLAWPVVALWPRKRHKANPVGDPLVLPVDRRRLMAACLVAGSVSFGTSAWVATTFGDLPPAYHDEFSYVLQAQTFLSSRTAFPSAPEPRLFDQMHVLNEGRFASRYLPGTGLWLMPFVALGHPYLAQWLAGAICAALAVLIGLEVATPRAGFLAGLLTGLSPGLALFSNLLLAHHPTLVGLMLFVWAFLRMQRTGHLAWALVSGVGLTFAMFCRPMTAAGMALPFGIWMLISGVRDRGAGIRAWWMQCVGLGIPLVAGFVVMGWYNRELTGSVWVSPYQQYTDTYTPRHVYGFNNVVRGEMKLGPRVIEQYDRWAENLDWDLARKNVIDRIVASGRWTLGLVPLAMAGALLLLCTTKLVPFEQRVNGTRSVLLLLASIVSLHLVHVPYWFVGIMNWHYVMESTPLLLVLTGVAADSFWMSCQAAGERIAPWWFAAVLGMAVPVNVGSVEGLWAGRVWQGADEVRFARARHGQFRRELDSHVRHRPAIVLVKPDPSDRHIDFVTNTPDLSGPVLVGRWLKEVPLARVRELYPDRAVYLYDVPARRWDLLVAPK